MPSLGGGGGYGGDDPSGGAGKNSGGHDTGGGGYGGYDFNTNNNIGRPKGVEADGNWGGQNLGSNTAWGVDPRTGSLVQVGAPSRMGGMMTTAAGYGLNQRDNWSKNGGMGSYGISDPRSSFYGQHYANRQKNIKADAYNRQGAIDQKFDEIFNKPGMSWDEKKRDLDALNKGLVGELENRGYDMGKVRSTHRSGGFLGALGDFFGAKTDDVDTMSEVAEKTPEWGYGPLGFGLGMMAPAVAKGVYEQTGSVPAAKYASKGIGWASGKISPPTPSVVKQATRALGLVGVPGMSQVSQIAAMANQARDLNYTGVTNPHGPAPSYEGFGNGGMMSSKPVTMASRAEQTNDGEPDLAAQWQRMWSTPYYGPQAV